MYALYIGNKNYSSWSLRPWVLLRALQIPFEERLVPFPETGTWEQFRAFSPTGRVPCLHDGATRVWPRDGAARAWARCAAAEMHSGFATLRNRCSMSCGVRIELPEWPPALLADVRRIDELWTEGLARFGGPFLAGAQFTAVDAFYAPVVYRAQTYALPLGEAAQGYMKRMLELPAMREWYEAALAESFRDPPHEAEILQSGRLLADHRASVAA
jgi:glutathione S-transferase